MTPAFYGNCSEITNVATLKDTEQGLKNTVWLWGVSGILPATVSGIQSILSSPDSRKGQMRLLWETAFGLDVAKIHIQNEWACVSVLWESAVCCYCLFPPVLVRVIKDVISLGHNATGPCRWKHEPVERGNELHKQPSYVLLSLVWLFELNLILRGGVIKMFLWLVWLAFSPYSLRSWLTGAQQLLSQVILTMLTLVAFFLSFSVYNTLTVFIAPEHCPRQVYPRGKGF